MRQARRVFESLVGVGNGLWINRSLISFMGDDLGGGAFLSQLIYWSKTLPDSRNGWFWKSFTEWKDEVCLSRYAVEKYSTQLQEMRILEVKLKQTGRAPTLHYRIDWEVLLEAYTKHVDTDHKEIAQSPCWNPQIDHKEIAQSPCWNPQMDMLESANPLHSLLTENKILSGVNPDRAKSLISKERSVPAFFSTNESTVSQPIKYPEIAAKKLYEGLAAKSKIIRPPNLIQWAGQIQQFFLEADVEKDEFDRVLSWYVEHVGGEYLVAAYSAKTFCDKFVRIRDKMQETCPPPEPAYVAPEVRIDPETVNMTLEEKRAWAKKIMDRMDGVIS